MTSRRTDEQVSQLLEKAGAGDLDAQNELIEAFDPLALKIAKRYCKLHPSASLEDVVQDARLQLVKCARSIDPSKSCRFAAYAGKAIEAALFRRKKPGVFRPDGTEDNPIEAPLTSHIMDGLGYETQDNSEQEERRTDFVNSLLGCLDTTDREIVSRHYGLLNGEGQTLAAVAAHLGISEATASRRHQAALLKMKTSPQAVLLPLLFRSAA